LLSNSTIEPYFNYNITKKYDLIVTQSISINDIDAFIFDFDGVLTNNYVQLDAQGNEWVSCNRSDGLAFDALRKLNIPAFIISSEKNLVVSARAKKLNIPSIQGVEDKVSAIKNLEIKHGFSPLRLFYVGNDINDFLAMKICGHSACPSDSHPMIKELSEIILENKGGQGIVRELLEKVLKIDLFKVLYLEKK